jgi:predicted S18 family serine protease
VWKAALEELTTFCGKHPTEIVNFAAKVIPVPERHIAPGGERETILPAQSNSHYSPDLVTSVRFSEAMYDTYRRMVGESVFYRHQIYRYQVKETECTAQALKEARAMIATLKKERHKDKEKIQELIEIIHEHNFLLQHND